MTPRAAGCCVACVTARLRFEPEACSATPWRGSYLFTLIVDRRRGTRARLSRHVHALARACARTRLLPLLAAPVLLCRRLSPAGLTLLMALCAQEQRGRRADVKVDSGLLPEFHVPRCFCASACRSERDPLRTPTLRALEFQGKSAFLSVCTRQRKRCAAWALRAAYRRGQ